MSLTRRPSPADARPLGVAVLGSTGSIGRQTVDVLRSAGPSRFAVVALAAGRDAPTLSEQAASLRPSVVALSETSAAPHLVLPTGTRILDAPDALERICQLDEVELVVVATGGIVSLRPVIAALRSGKVVATANKETLVAGGHLVMRHARTRAAEIEASDPSAPLSSPLAWLRPIDSEHSAIWQCLAGEAPEAIARLVLTASGGPFRRWPADRLATAQPEDALAHPTWDMGPKVTVDSATLMNKGLEVIEARWLYDVPYDRVEVVIHPQSLIHSLVEFVDGSLKAQLGLPDMRIPIQYALTFPERIHGPAPRLDLIEHAQMTFEPPDPARFPALTVARSAGLQGPRASAALIAADDVAVARFLDGSIPFPAIVDLVAEALARFGDGPAPDLDEVVALDGEVRAWAMRARVPSGGPV
jgi:1-deoxy-D-xylulose-5-phosphate reductoisomerase